MDNKSNSNTSYPTSEELNSDLVDEFGEYEEDILEDINRDLEELAFMQKSNGQKLRQVELKKFGRCVGRILGVARARGFFNQLFSKGMSPVRKSIEAFLKCKQDSTKIKKYMEMINEIKNSVKSGSKSQLMRISPGFRNNNWARFIIYISSNGLNFEKTNVSKKIFDLDDSLENVMSVKTDNGDGELIQKFKNNVYESMKTLQQTTKTQSERTANKLKRIKG